MILGRLEWFLAQTITYPEIMSGFRCGRNSLDNVIDLVSRVEQAKANRKMSTAVFFVKSAFDNIAQGAMHDAI